MRDNAPLTIGVDHVGLAVKNLDSARRFFANALAGSLLARTRAIRRRFVSDGNGIVTLWQVEDSEKYVPFDRRRNVGLHHLALKVVDRDALDALHACRAHGPTP